LAERKYYCQVVLEDRLRQALARVQNIAMFKALIGDLFASGVHTLVNPINCVGAMGKGVALEFKKRFPANFEDYAKRCECKQVRLGEPYPFRDLSGRLIVNFPTKDHWRSPARLSDIERGLDHFVRHFAEWRIESIAVPAARLRERRSRMVRSRAVHVPQALSAAH
jgi:O-acetyl-ADP-ribose deacetylase (regulator of RNase III)